MMVVVVMVVMILHHDELDRNYLGPSGRRLRIRPLQPFHGVGNRLQQIGIG